MCFRIMSLALIMFALSSGAFVPTASAQSVSPNEPAPADKKMLEEMAAKAKKLKEAENAPKHSPHPGQSVQCPGLKLAGAAGLPNGDTHSYKFGGTCTLFQQKSMVTVPLTDFPVVVKASWDTNKHRLTERLEFVGSFNFQGESYSGDVHTLFDCSNDPIVTGMTLCKAVQHTNSTGLDALSSAYNSKRPYAQGTTSLAAATAMSANSKPDEGPPPKQATAPPPKKPPLPGMKSADDIASHLTIRSPNAGEVVSGTRLRLDVAGPEKLIQKFGLDGVDLEWQWSPATERLPGRAGNWQTKPMLTHLKWTKREGQIFAVLTDLPMSRFSESTRWRVRASALPAVQPTEWVTFSVVPLDQSAR